MTKLHTIGKIEIRLFDRDHRPAHFHVVTPDGDAMIEIETMSVLRGRIAKRDLGAALDWARANATMLVAEWNRLNPTLKV